VDAEYRLEVTLDWAQQTGFTLAAWRIDRWTAPFGERETVAMGTAHTQPTPELDQALIRTSVAMAEHWSRTLNDFGVQQGLF
jgi:hypothetical protein